MEFSLPTAVISAAIASFVLFLAMLYLGSTRDAPRGIRFWSASFALNGFRYIVIYWSIMTREPIGLFLSESLHIVSIVLLSAGAFRFLGRPVSLKMVFGVCALFVGWVAFTTLINNNFLLRSIPLYGVAGLLIIWVGVIFLRRGKLSYSRGFRNAGLLFIVWGIHKLDFPVIRPIEWLAPYGFLLAVTLYMAIAVSLILIVQENMVDKLKRENNRRLVAERRAEDANRAKSQFLASMSHELRTPLNAIIGFAQMMSGEVFGPHSNTKYKEYSKDIQDSGEHLISVVNDILDLSKVESGAIVLTSEPIDLADALQECSKFVPMTDSGTRERLSVTVSPDTPSIVSDPRAFRQIMINILSNADKFTPDEGTIRIETEETSGGAVRIAITDTGTGIAAEDLERVLEPFGQARRNPEITQEGTGLGLSLSKQLMELQGGSLELSSNVGKGTTVTLIFPAADT